MLRVAKSTGMCSRWLPLAMVLAVVMALVVSPLAMAGESTPEAPASEVQPPVILENSDPTTVPAPTSAPAPTTDSEPTIVPEPPADPDPLTEPEPTEVPEPTPAPDPTEIAAREVSVTPDPLETADATEMETPQPTATVVPEPTATPTPSPTPQPSPTPVPIPVITWSQTEQVSCVLLNGQAAGLRFAESRTYRCDVSANVTSDLAMPTDMQIEWTVDVSFPDSYQLQLPQGSPASVSAQQSTGASSTQYVVAQPWQRENAQHLVFDLVVTRTTCAVVEQVLTVQASPEISTVASEAEITRLAGNLQPQPAQLISAVVNSDAPSIAFDGPIMFDSVGATANGLEKNTSRGSATIIVSGDWDPCTTWTVDLSGTVDVPAETPAQFRAVSINKEPIPGDACDLSAPCDVIALPSTGSASTPLRYTIGLELTLHESTPVGSFGINLKSDIRGEVVLP